MSAEAGAAFHWASFLLMWLRVFLCSCGVSISPIRKWFTNKDWKAMFETADGFNVASSARCASMLVELRKLIKDSCSMGIELNELTEAGTVDDQIVQEVMWELYESNFRLELIQLDRYMVSEPVEDGDEVELALPFVKAMFKLLKGWLGPKPLALQKLFSCKDDQSAVWAVEEVMANYYACIFLKMFHRPAFSERFKYWIIIDIHVSFSFPLLTMMSEDSYLCEEAVKVIRCKAHALNIQLHSPMNEAISFWGLCLDEPGSRTVQGLLAQMALDYLLNSGLELRSR
ncbi:hypothetical protein BDP27DRAFT_1369952 [Rhodocollybia butyracea]|uniref:Uncharacterized protein n=1 Tax=Rhodocollybia butyracea TaxID=206335 RepID=A0A9P5PD10_9AGAR|nr:hypothetical protein BDP27DRAFT_1369952 [Rhodocollybia butyracea]